ncbi:MAG: hypothetical protein AMJ64_10005 [Betaproteobacteria bacterium SG8_39]|nr:MAG: hypothetical protein AMJ64_10005 [Betaproteobacteria bacterium SG8_39]
MYTGAADAAARRLSNARSAIQRLLSRPFARHRHADLEDHFGITQDAPGEAFARIAELPPGVPRPRL